jgi:hypothetical protein
MIFKFIELIAILGVLYLLWRQATKLGKEAAEQKKLEADARETATARETAADPAEAETNDKS